MLDLIKNVFVNNGLITAFVVVGLTMWLAYFISDKFTKGRIHGSAIAIVIGLVLAYFGGVATGGTKGIADVSFLAGMGFLGGSMLRDFAIVATSFGANFDEIKKAGFKGVISLFIGVVLSFIVGVIFAFVFGYRDAVSITTIGAGTVTYIVGPVTGAALNASSEVIAISIAAGLVKAVLVMVGTPFIARFIGLNNPTSAMVYGGLMGTTSGVTGGLAATDPKLVPYGAVTATFYTGLGCLLCPTILFLITDIFL
ncbi:MULTISPECIES: malonate transporter subunit MadM [Ureibacillus]|jgi:malonate transporter MadM subunit|uniref:Malonate transporter MadM subunit n=1 Tax=Ureibacillus thermosphaericus TaxID=51173 RepID=A0A840PNA2_URETH|nr:malonate transporter subunit MadM [Ureibacillus thermosphaericus]MBB5147979.1 malonate transporter MadM subunit [Ureibacillus thermosphaericus]NKZ30692.1 malonate transporter subunit MadM [Ureibacillus thermosphaericus]